MTLVMATMGQRLDVTGHRDEIHVDTEQLGDDVMALTRRIKDALDPQGILNPGAVLR